MVGPPSIYVWGECFDFRLDDFASGRVRFCFGFGEILLLRFFKLILKQRLSASSSQALYWHWSGGSSNNCVAVTLVLLTPCRSELGCDVLADLTDVLQRQLVQYSSNLRSVCNFFSKYNRILNCARFWEKTGEKLGTDLAVVLVSKVRFCITGNVASSSSVVVILAKKKPFDCIRKS